jgi:hypothetical protein
MNTASGLQAGKPRQLLAIELLLNYVDGGRVYGGRSSETIAVAVDDPK